MTDSEQALLREWQAHRDAPKEVRLEEDYDALLDRVEFSLNAPDGLQGEPR